MPSLRVDERVGDIREREETFDYRRVRVYAGKRVTFLACIL